MFTTLGPTKILQFVLPEMQDAVNISEARGIPLTLLQNSHIQGRVNAPWIRLGMLRFLFARYITSLVPFFDNLEFPSSTNDEIQTFHGVLWEIASNIADELQDPQIFQERMAPFMNGNNTENALGNYLCSQLRNHFSANDLPGLVHTLVRNDLQNGPQHGQAEADMVIYLKGARDRTPFIVELKLDSPYTRNTIDRNLALNNQMKRYEYMAVYRSTFSHESFGDNPPPRSTYIRPTFVVINFVRRGNRGRVRALNGHLQYGLFHAHDSAFFRNMDPGPVFVHVNWDGEVVDANIGMIPNFWQHGR